MAGKLNLSKGYAPDYPWKNQAKAGAWLAGAARRPGTRLIWASTLGLVVLALATF